MLQAEVQTSDSVNVQDIPFPAISVSDGTLIERVKSGNNNAYGSLMRRYNQRLFRIARSIVNNDVEALDIVQEAHIKAFTKIHDYRGDSQFSIWLSSITRNEALMYLRKQKKELIMSEGELNFVESSTSIESTAQLPRPDACIENIQLKALINENIDVLPSNFRTVFVLRAIEQLSVKETAEILDIKQETVKTRYFRAKRLLRSQIQSYLETVGMHVYEVGGRHCDVIVYNVLQHIFHLNREKMRENHQ